MKTHASGNEGNTIQHFHFHGASKQVKKKKKLAKTHQSQIQVKTKIHLTSMQHFSSCHNHSSSFSKDQSENFGYSLLPYLSSKNNAFSSI
jgi:hypothetical protein